MDCHGWQCLAADDHGWPSMAMHDAWPWVTMDGRGWPWAAMSDVRARVGKRTSATSAREPARQVKSLRKGQLSSHSWTPRAPCATRRQLALQPRRDRLHTRRRAPRAAASGGGHGRRVDDGEDGARPLPVRVAVGAEGRPVPRGRAHAATRGGGPRWAAGVLAGHQQPVATALSLREQLAVLREDMLTEPACVKW